MPYIWETDGVGKVRLYHRDCQNGKNISSVQDYERMLDEGWTTAKVPKRSPEEERDKQIVKSYQAVADTLPAPKKRGRPFRVKNEVSE